jgi:TolA-binding protein
MANTARNKPSTEPATITSVQEIPMFQKLENFYENNKKNINTGLTIVAIAIIGYFSYEKLYLGPQEEKAGTAISFAQRYFEVDSLNKALNGDGQHNGFLQVEKKYGGTKVGNLCHYYAGVCYLKMGDFNNAVKQLKDFDAKGTMLEYTSNGLLGDAYMETNNPKKALECYAKAVGNKDDKTTTPTYLFRAGLVYEMQKQPEEAKKMYLRVRDEYPKSPQAREINKYLARMGVID